MDGNGRWAKQRNLPRIEGHRRGAKAVERTLKSVRKAGIRNLTLYAFSVENWNRPENEVDGLMKLLEQFLNRHLPDLIRKEFRLRVIGRYQELPKRTRDLLKKAEKATQDFDEWTLCLALNYGSRSEIVDATKAIIQAAQNGTLNPAKLDYEQLRSFLYTGNMPDPDLVIRTSGESRLSNFLLLQSAYAEIHVCPLLWPEFDEAAFEAALEDYASRERRYGKTAEQL